MKVGKTARSLVSPSSTAWTWGPCSPYSPFIARINFSCFLYSPWFVYSDGNGQSSISDVPLSSLGRFRRPVLSLPFSFIPLIALEF